MAYSERSDGQDGPGSGTVLRLDHLVISLLDGNDGVFLGEKHDAPAVLQSLIKLLPLFKASGVGTVSVELPQNIVDEMGRMKNLKEMRARWPEHGLSPAFELVKAAQKLGMHVLGHDKPWPSEVESVLQRHDRKTDAIDYAYYLWASSEEGMQQRDTFAAAHIRERRVGKVLVLGGSAHSGSYSRKDLEDASALDRSGVPKGIDVRSRYEGLDKKLGIPSIDYDRAGTDDPIGVTRQTDGKFNSYEVSLPKDLGELRGTWPSRSSPGGGRGKR